MAFADLREWMEALHRARDLTVIDAPVDAHLELGAICRWSVDKGPNQALLFTNVNGSAIPVLANSLSTRERLNLALGVDGSDRERFVLDRWDQGVDPVPYSGQAPVQDVIHRGAEASLDIFPIPWHNVEDGGRYISMGVLICKDPDTGVHNLSYARIQVNGPRHAGINILPNKHARHNLEAWSQRGEAMPVAVAIGLEPVLNLAAAASPPRGASEYRLAGAWRGTPVEVVTGVSVPLDVPARAEIVVEGEIRADESEDEGPFGEFTGYYGRRGPRNVLHVRAVTHRQRPVFQTLYTGLPVCDNHIMQELLRSAKVWDRVRQVLPNVTAVYCPPEAGNGFTVWIALKKHHDGEPRLAMMAAWTAFEYVKHVFVVDDDVDIYDARQRDWAVATRVQADHDVWVVPGLVGMALDPSAQGRMGDPERLGIFERARNFKAGLGVDVTRPLGVPFEKVVEVPKQWMDRVVARLPELFGHNG